MTSDNYHQIYYHTNNMYATATNLIHFALGQIIRTTHLKDLDELKELIVKDGETSREMNEEKIEKLKKFIFDGLIDSIRISICFENFIKAILLSNGYIVHIIDRNKDKDFHNSQKETPIKINDYLKKYPFQIDPATGKHFIPNVTKNTLSFSIISGKGYQEIVKIPDSILDFVKQLYGKRNSIHFYNVETFSYGATTIKDFENLKKYSTEKLSEINNRLVKHLKGPEHHYILPLKE
jgi:hypothetical protein